MILTLREKCPYTEFIIICIYTYIYIYIYIYIYCKYTYMYRYVYIYIYTIYIHTSHAYTCIIYIYYIYTFIYRYVCIYIYILYMYMVIMVTTNYTFSKMCISATAFFCCFHRIITYVHYFTLLTNLQWYSKFNNLMILTRELS